MIFRIPTGFRVFALATLVVFVVVALLPVAIVFAASFWADGSFSLKAYSSVLAESRQWGLLRNTLVIAIGSAVAATLLGIPVAFAIDRVRGRARAALEWATALPLLLPPYISATAWMDLLTSLGLFRIQMDGNAQISASYVPASTTGILPPLMSLSVILVMAFSLFPLVTLMLCSALRNYDNRIEEPALLVGTKRRALRSIKWPILVPHAAAGTLAVFILALVEFTVPSLLQVNVYTVEIYSRFSTTYDARSAAAQSFPLILLGLVSVLIYFVRIRPHRHWLSGIRRNDHPHVSHNRTRLPDWFLSASCGLVLAAVVPAPLAFLFYRSLPLTSYVEVWETAREEISSSLVLAAISATAITILAAAMVLAARFRPRSARLYAFSAVPFLISGPLLGVGLVWLWNRPGPFAIVYDTPAVLVLACVGRFLFFAYYGLRAGTQSISARFDEAAAISGISWYRYVTGVLLPLTAPALTAVWGLGFIFSLRELDAAVLVAPPGWNPLAVRLFSLLHYGPSQYVAALSIVTLVMVLAAAAGTFTLYNQAKRIAHAGH